MAAAMKYYFSLTSQHISFTMYPNAADNTADVTLFLVIPTYSGKTRLVNQIKLHGHILKETADYGLQSIFCLCHLKLLLSQGVLNKNIPC
jgi:hypothetical protein